MKLNIKKFMMTEMGGELEETIKAWDQALEERRKATPGIGDPDQGLGFGRTDGKMQKMHSLHILSMGRIVQRIEAETGRKPRPVTMAT